MVKRSYRSKQMELRKVVTRRGQVYAKCNTLPLPPSQVAVVVSPTATNAKEVNINQIICPATPAPCMPLFSLSLPSHLATKGADINQIICSAALAMVAPALYMPTATSAFDTLVDNTSWPSLALPSHHYDDCSVKEVDIDDEVIRDMWMACD